MAEPIATGTSAAAVAVTSVGAVSLLPGVDPGTVLGAFAGAAVFALNSGELTVAKKLSFLVLWPLSWLPIISATPAVVFAFGCAFGTASGVKALRRYDAGSPPLLR